MGDTSTWVWHQALTRLLQRVGLCHNSKTGSSDCRDGGQHEAPQHVPAPGGLVHYWHATRANRRYGIVQIERNLNPDASCTCIPSGTSVKQIAGGISGYMWDNYLSYSRLLSGIKYVFWDDIVLEKNWYVKNFWFWSCGWIEDLVLGLLEFFLPEELVPDFLVKTCMRPNVPPRNNW